MISPVSSQEAAARENDSEDSAESNDKPIPAKINAAALNDQDTNESSDSNDDEASGQKQPSENAHKHRDHSDHLETVVDENDDSKTEKVNDKAKADKFVKSVDGDDDDSSEKSQKVDDKTKSAAAALEADKPAATSESEEEAESDNRKPLADNTYPKAPAATAAEDRQQQSRESDNKDTKVIVSDDSDSDSDNQKNEEVPAPGKASGTLTQEETEGVANLTEDKQMDIRQDGEDGLAIIATTTKSPNAGTSISVSFSLIFLSIMLYLLQ
uniref:Uncharacterized protein n=1 Tax=Panagrolaimus sp. ES5 TaxID=591445 RepID=A0AC34G8H8_9BILA